MKKLNIQNATVYIFENQARIDGVEVITHELHYTYGFQYVIVYSDGSKTQFFSKDELSEKELDHKVYMLNY